MADTVDAVAQAIWRADPIRSVNCPEIPDNWLPFLQGMARAAIDALGLTEEWRCTGWVFTRDEDAARKQHESNGGEIHSRLVSGWVRKDNTNE